MTTEEIINAILEWQAKLAGITVEEQIKLNELITEQYEKEGIQRQFLRRRDAPVTEADRQQQRDYQRIYLDCIIKLFQSN